jgi:hypothetical protein
LFHFFLLISQICSITSSHRHRPYDFSWSGKMEEARNHYHTRGSTRGGGAGTAAERDLLLRWGNRKRLRCVKVHRCDVEAAATIAAKKAAIGQRRATAAAAAAQHHQLATTTASTGLCAFFSSSVFYKHSTNANNYDHSLL